MTGSLNALFAATVVFVGAHFLLSSQPVRAVLIERLGETVFRAGYSLIVGASFVWLLLAYRSAPYVELWPSVPALAWVPILVMPISLFLIVAGLTTRSPTMVGGEQTLADSVHDPAPGILRVTRHPFLWGTALWAVSHLIVNGDIASLVLTAGILLLSLGGMHHIDVRREAALGSDWGPMKLTTSALPFVAIVQGRTTMDWQGIGWWRPVVALVLYAAFLHLHAWLFGVSPLPV